MLDRASVMAGRAQPVQFKLVGGNREAVPGGDLLLQAFDIAILELYYLAAIGTNEMIMMPLVGNVVVLGLASKMARLSKPGVAE